MTRRILMLALVVLFAASGTTSAYARTGFIKARTNEDNHMGKDMRKDSSKAKEEQEKTDEAAEAEDAEEDKAAAEEEKAEKEGKDE